MIALLRPYPDEVIGSVLARGARRFGLSWTRLLYLATGRSASSAPFLMPYALGRLAEATGTSPECLLERHTLFPYAVAFMATARREKFRARALEGQNVCGLDCLSHVVLGRTPYRRFCPVCLANDLRDRGESYWRRSHLLPGTQICTLHDVPLLSTKLPLQGGHNASDGLLPIDVVPSAPQVPLPLDVLQSIAAYSVRAMIRMPADRNWLERYCVAAFALGYRLRRTAVAGKLLALDLKNFYGDQFLVSMGASMDLEQKSPWPTLLLRPQYPTRLATPKHVLMLTFLEHAAQKWTIQDAPYRPPGLRRRDYHKVDQAALCRMRIYVQNNARDGARLTVQSLIMASGERACMKRFRDRFPKSKQFLARFRQSRHAARRIQPHAFVGEREG